MIPVHLLCSNKKLLQSRLASEYLIKQSLTKHFSDNMMFTLLSILTAFSITAANAAVTLP